MGNVIGITGGIASGKSTISQYIGTELQFTIIDADIAARVVVEPGMGAYDGIITAFGESILLPDRTIDRAKLGSIIFSDTDKRLLLNSIVHPAVRKYMLAEKDRAFARGEKTVFMDIPLLFESKLTGMVDKTILIYVDKETQIERLMTRNGFNLKEAQDRISSQMPLDEKRKLADAIVDNNGTIDQAQQQIHAILKNWDIV